MPAKQRKMQLRFKIPKKLHLSLYYKTQDMVLKKCILIYCLTCSHILGQDNHTYLVNRFGKMK